MAGGYNLRNKQVDDVGEENMDKSENFEISIDEQTDISTAAFISSLKSQVQYLKEELKLKNEIILNLSEAVKSLGRNEITSSAVNPNLIPVSSDNAVNSKSVPSNDAPDKINSAVDFREQLKEVRQSYRTKYYSAKSREVVDLVSTNNNTNETDPSESEKSVIIPTRENENVIQKSKSAVHTWRKGSTLIVGDSMLGGVKEGLIGPRGNIKVRSFPGATLDDMIDYLRPLLRKRPDRVLLHAATNNAISHDSHEIIQKILDVKAFIENEVKGCTVIISSPINRLDNQKCATVIRNVNAQLKNIGNINLMANDNITTKHLGMKKLHLNMSDT